MDVESHVLMHNPPVSKKSTFVMQETGTKQENNKHARHFMPSDKAPPLQALTKSDIQEMETGDSGVFSARVLQDYCIEINNGVPRSKQKRAEIVIKYWKSKHSSTETNKNT
jgi:hypothetical protein